MRDFTAQMSPREKLGLWLLGPYLRGQYVAQELMWDRAHEHMRETAKYERFQWGVLMAIRRLLNGQPVASERAIPAPSQEYEQSTTRSINLNTPQTSTENG